MHYIYIVHLNLYAMEKQAILDALRVIEQSLNATANQPASREQLSEAFEEGFKACFNKLKSYFNSNEYFYADGEIGGDTFSVNISLEEHHDSIHRYLDNTNVDELFNDTYAEDEQA